MPLRQKLTTSSRAICEGGAQRRAGISGTGRGEWVPRAQGGVGPSGSVREEQAP